MNGGHLTAYVCYSVDGICKVRVYRDRVEALSWMQLFCLGEVGFASMAW